MFTSKLLFLSLFTIFVTQYLVAAQPTAQGQLPIITLPYCQVQAAVFNETGDFYVFQNVRFAAPPTGSLRFQEPQPPLLETTVNDGSVTGNCSTQEDCLFLDIYVPATAQAGSNFSVVVYLYGGGYQGGSKDNNNPAGLLKMSGNSIIFVAPNYRVRSLSIQRC